MSEVTGTVMPAGAAPVEVASPIAGAAVEATPVAIDESAQLDAIDAAIDSGEISKADAQVLKKKLKIKVHGVETEEEIDFSDDEGLRKLMQKSKAFDGNAQELAQMRNQMNAIAKMIEDDPEGFLEKMGKNVDEMSEKRLTRKIEEMKKSPEQIEKEKLIKERDELRAESERIKKEKEEAINEQYKQKHAAAIEHDIKSALAKADTVLPKNDPSILLRVGQAMHLAMMNGRPDITAAEVLPYVEAKYKAELASSTKGMSPAQFEALFGKELLDAWRKDRIAKAKPQVPTNSSKVADTGKSAKSQENNEAPKKSYKDFFKLI